MPKCLRMMLKERYGSQDECYGKTRDEEGSRTTMLVMIRLDLIRPQ